MLLKNVLDCAIKPNANAPMLQNFVRHINASFAVGSRQHRFGSTLSASSSTYIVKPVSKIIYLFFVQFLAIYFKLHTVYFTVDLFQSHDCFFGCKNEFEFFDVENAKIVFVPKYSCHITWKFVCLKVVLTAVYNFWEYKKFYSLKVF